MSPSTSSGQVKATVPLSAGGSPDSNGMPDEFQMNDARESGSPAGAPSAEVEKLESVASLTEDLVLAQLANRDLSCSAVEQISRNSVVMKSRKVRLAVASHPRAPRRITMRLIRELYTFELMRFALMPTAAADLRRVADELLLSRLTSITLGERIF